MSKAVFSTTVTAGHLFLWRATLESFSFSRQARKDDKFCEASSIQVFLHTVLGGECLALELQGHSGATSCMPIAIGFGILIANAWNVGKDAEIAGYLTPQV